VPSLRELRHIVNHPTKNRRVRHDNAAYEFLQSGHRSR
jgi:hypothetical protein